MISHIASFFNQYRNATAKKSLQLHYFHFQSLSQYHNETNTFNLIIFQVTISSSTRSYIIPIIHSNPLFFK